MRHRGEALGRLAGGIHPPLPDDKRKLLGSMRLDNSFLAHPSSHERARRSNDLASPSCVAIGGCLAVAVLAASLLLAANPALAESAKEAVARLHAQVSQGDTRVETWRQLARALEETGDLAGAEAALRRGLTQDPRCAPALRDLGMLYIDANRTTEALPLLEQALSVEPEDQETRDALSYVLYQTGDAVRSLEVSNRGQPLIPAQAEALVEAARFYTEWGHQGAAERALAKAQELAPNSLAVSGALLKRSRPSAEQSATPPTSLSPGAEESTGVRAPREASGQGGAPKRGVVVALALTGALLVLVALRVVFVFRRGAGELAVTMNDPQERKGSFGVRLGKHVVARLRRAERHRARRQMADTAELHERAGPLVDAAELQESQGELAQAALFFERVGDFVAAAEDWRAAGDLLRAGEAFAAGEEYESAADCFREARATAQLLGVLEKGGAFLAAGELALAQGQVWRAIRNLEQVDPRSPAYAGACELLATALTREGRIERAIQVLEDVRHREPGRPEIAAQLETLRQKVTCGAPAKRARKAQ